MADVDRRVLFTGGLGVHPAPPMGSVPAGIAVMSSWPEAVRYLLDSLRGYSGTR